MSAYTGVLCNILCYTFEVPLRSYASAKKSKENFAYISVMSWFSTAKKESKTFVGLSPRTK